MQLPLLIDFRLVLTISQIYQLGIHRLSPLTLQLRFPVSAMIHAVCVQALAFPHSKPSEAFRRQIENHEFTQISTADGLHVLQKDLAFRD